jgi:chromate transporter
MKGFEIYWALAAQFAVLSLLAFGGANAVVPEMHRLAVEVNHWMSGQDFAATFALAQAAPGPNVMISTLIGLKVAGVPGALIATVAMCGPSCLLVVAASRVWDRYRERPWRLALAAGLAPVTVGMVSASAWLLCRAADRDWRLALLTAAAAATAYFTRLNPLWPLGVAAALGLSGALG